MNRKYSVYNQRQEEIQLSGACTIINILITMEFVNIIREGYLNLIENKRHPEATVNIILISLFEF